MKLFNEYGCSFRERQQCLHFTRWFILCRSRLLGILLTGLLASCSDSSSVGGASAQNNDDNTAGVRGGDCTYTLDRDINSATTWVNTNSECDYELIQSIDVGAVLTIEPGTVIRSRAGNRIVLSAGQLQARGTASQRIVFEGLSSTRGFWKGIDIERGRDVVMDYVDIKDAGQNCPDIFCPDYALLVDDTPLSFTNSSVSNSGVYGMGIVDEVILEAFSNNRFYGNNLAGLGLPIEMIPQLDQASDYYGLEKANGLPYVDVGSSSQRSGGTFKWKALNAPYRVDRSISIEGGIVELEPGVEIVFASGTHVKVEGNGSIQALGTAEDPVIFRGAEAMAGYWDGVRMRGAEDNIFDHTIFSHSGNTDASLTAAYAAIRLDKANVTIRNTSFTDNEWWGIYCEESVFTDSIVFDGGGNRFSNNQAGDIGEYCVVQ